MNFDHNQESITPNTLMHPKPLNPSRQPLICFWTLEIRCVSSGVSFKWNHVLCMESFVSIFFTQYNVPEIHPCCYVYKFAWTLNRHSTWSSNATSPQMKSTLLVLVTSVHKFGSPSSEFFLAGHPHQACQQSPNMTSSVSFKLALFLSNAMAWANLCLDSWKSLKPWLPVPLLFQFRTYTAHTELL